MTVNLTPHSASDMLDETNTRHKLSNADWSIFGYSIETLSAAFCGLAALIFLY